MKYYLCEPIYSNEYANMSGSIAAFIWCIHEIIRYTIATWQKIMWSAVFFVYTLCIFSLKCVTHLLWFVVCLWYRSVTLWNKILIVIADIIHWRIPMISYPIWKLWISYTMILSTTQLKICKQIKVCKIIRLKSCNLIGWEPITNTRGPLDSTTILEKVAHYKIDIRVRCANHIHVVHMKKNVTYQFNVA